MATAMVATDTAMDMATATDTTATTARGRLSLPPLLRLMPLPDTATTAMATDTATDMVTAMATAMDTTASTARGRLMPSLDTDTTATTVTAMDTVMDTVMATDTAMDTATMDREGTDC